ncbi:hypothetical protein RJ55_05643 [Drechmeria coniospora]|nr:hypothetical protein RJ55_05643 [Drechmeria coniospora]
MPEPAAKVAMNDDKGKNAARDIFDTAPLNKDSTGESQRHAATSRTVSDDGISSAGEVKKPTVVESSGPAAELDDTADRYERRRRLESQEEKIFYSPEDDDDYQPQMSATSYPGQEWNPFGESEPWQDE